MTSDGPRTLTSEIVKNCTLECKDPCYDQHYEVRFVKIGNMEHTVCIYNTEDSCVGDAKIMRLNSVP
ncbi:hypothetical protein TNCV_3150181 [Trichonephila clavipes]|nr:hypothetical protein TNCV_3150181 [Trichonephila clavipes]